MGNGVNCCFAGQRVVQCYCTRVRKYGTAVMVIAGRSEKMAKRHERIT